jgi:phospholipase/carboxylesterase
MSKDAYIHTSLPGVPGGPLMFLFHGTGGNENQLLGLALDLLPGTAAISPRGDVSEHGAARFFRRAAEGIYDMEDLATRTRKMSGFVRAHVDAAKPSSVIGLGFSNGANILASLLFAEPKLFDAAVLMHPLIPFEPKIEGDLAGKAVLITAGRKDPICPPHLTSRLESHLRALGANVTVEWHEGGHEMRQNELVAARDFLAPYRKEKRASESPRMTGESSEIQMEDTGSKGRYFLRGAGGAEAEMTFSKAGDHLIIIDHTDVPDAFRGQGAGLRLVTRAVEDARRVGKKIIPLCPFANAQFKRHQEWADVLKT